MQIYTILPPKWPQIIHVKHHNQKKKILLPEPKNILQQIVFKRVLSGLNARICLFAASFLQVCQNISFNYPSDPIDPCFNCVSL